MVWNTSELLPDPETSVNTVSRRFGISMLTSLRLFSRAPWTRMRSWLSATCGLGETMSVIILVADFGRVQRAAPEEVRGFSEHIGGRCPAPRFRVVVYREVRDER